MSYPQTLFPLQFKRQQAYPIDVDQVFEFTADRVAYLTNARRYAGMIVADTELEQMFMLNTARDAWIAISGSGPTGPTGPAGSAGAAGSNGPTGPQGNPGVNLQSKTVTGNSYTITLADRDYLIDVDNPTECTINGLDDISIPVNFTVMFHQLGAGKVKIANDFATIYASNGYLRTSGQYAQMALTRKSVAPNQWRLTGDRGA